MENKSQKNASIKNSKMPPIPNIKITQLPYNYFLTGLVTYFKKFFN